jgi:hypothetical protein
LVRVPAAGSLDCSAVQAASASDGSRAEPTDSVHDDCPGVVAGAIIEAVVAGVGDFAGVAFEELVGLFPGEGLEGRRRLHGSAPEAADGVALCGLSVRRQALVFWAQAIAVNDFTNRLDGHSARRELVCGLAA